MTTIIAKKYKHISGKERFLISRMRYEGASISYITKIIGRHKSTISLRHYPILSEYDIMKVQEIINCCSTELSSTYIL